jgi:hypothetical protein
LLRGPPAAFGDFWGAKSHAWVQGTRTPCPIESCEAHLYPIRLAFARSLSRIRSVTPRTGPRPPYAGPAPPALSTGSTGGRRNRPLFPVSLWVFLILFLFFLLVFLSCYWFLFLYSCYLGCNLATSGVQFCTLTGAALHPHFTKAAPTFVQPCPLPVQTCTPSSCRFRARTRRMSSLSTAFPQPLR